MTTLRVEDNRDSSLRVLIPLDGSSFASQALVYATSFPLEQVTLLHVAPEGHLAGAIVPDSEEERGVRSDVPDLEKLASTFAALNVDARVEWRYGDVAEEIIAASEAHDLIIMTTRGRGAAGRMLFGSVADRVSRASVVPTLLIRLDIEKEGVANLQRILVPLDGSKRAEAALAVVMRLAALVPVPVHLVRAMDMNEVLDRARATDFEFVDGALVPADETQTYKELWDTTVNEVQTYLETTAGSLQRQGITTAACVLHGTPSIAILDEIKPGDLIVMTSHGRGGFRRWLLGSVAEKLVREATAPVLLVPTRGRMQEE